MRRAGGLVGGVLIVMVSACGTGSDGAIDDQNVGSYGSSDEQDTSSDQQDVGSNEQDSSSDQQEIASDDQCDTSTPYAEGDFSFTYNLDSSLPDEWVEEFTTIMGNLSEWAPVPACVHDVPGMSSPMNIYAWNGAVENPFPERPDMRGASISGDGSETWMVLEIPEDEFTYDALHRYSVIVHEYWHVFQLGLTRDNADPVWLWEGGAKIAEELYLQQEYGQSQFDSNLFPLVATGLSQPTDFEDYVGGDLDINYNTSAFMVLALARQLQEEQGLSEARAFEVILKDFQAAKLTEPDWKIAFAETFSMSPEEFYATLDQYPTITSDQDWFEGDVLDVPSLMPSKDLTFTDVLSASAP